MVLYAKEFFEKYWKKRQYKHPGEKKRKIIITQTPKEQKKIARKFFTAGFNTRDRCF